MTNNSSDQARQKLCEDYQDSLFKLVMYDVAEEEGQLFLEEKKLKNNPGLQPSQTTIQKFSQQLEVRLKKSKAHERRWNICQVLNKVAVVMLIVIAIFFTTVVTVEAVRVRVLDFLMDIQKEYTSFQLKDSSNGSEGGSVTIDWHQSYVPTYIPKGYEISTVSNGKLSKNIEFKNSQGSLITYMELDAGAKPALDTENASVFKTVNINGHEGTMVVKNSLVTVIWAMNDHMFMIRGTIEQDLVLKMAEGVKYIN